MDAIHAYVLTDKRGQVFTMRFFNSEPPEVQVQWLRRFYLVSRAYWGSAGSGATLELGDQLDDTETTGTGILHPSRFPTAATAALSGTLTIPPQNLEFLHKALAPPKDKVDIQGYMLTTSGTGGRRRDQPGASLAAAQARFEHYVEDGPLRLVVSGFGDFLLFISALGAQTGPEDDSIDLLVLMDISRVVANLISAVLQSKLTIRAMCKHLPKVIMALHDQFLDNGTIDYLNPDDVMALHS